MKHQLHRLAIVGLGGMGNWHRETIGQIAELELSGSYDFCQGWQWHIV